MTKEQTNSWGSVEEILKYYDITNPDVELQLLRHFFDVKAKLISQEREKMIEEIKSKITGNGIVLEQFRGGYNCAKEEIINLLQK